MINAKRHLDPVQIMVIGIIIVVITSVATLTIFTISNHHTTINIESEIPALASEYYEKYFFPNLEYSILTHSNSSPSEVLSNYASTGFSKVPLRQILAHTNPSPSIVAYINQHCDTGTTLIHFFPEPPFDATSYHANYSYSCNL